MLSFYYFDVRIKLLCLLLLTILVFFVDTFLSAVCLLLFFIVIRIISKVLFNGFVFFRILTLLAVIIITLQTLFGPDTGNFAPFGLTAGSDYIIKPLFPHSFPVLGGMGSLKWEGFFLGIVIICRLAALMIILPVFTGTTPPHLIALGLCSLKFNYKIAFIITMAFNLIAFFRDEALRIMDAQQLRGLPAGIHYRKRHVKTGGYKRISFVSGFLTYSRLLVPLMLAAMRKAQNSSIAMDSRAFGIYKTRTWIDKLYLKTGDFWLIFICIVLFIIILLINSHFFVNDFFRAAI